MKSFSSEVEIITDVEITIDETEFTEQFMQEFRETFYPFQTIEDHIKHLSQLAARGLAEPGTFVEGYGLIPYPNGKFPASADDDTPRMNIIIRAIEGEANVTVFDEE